MYYRFIIDLNKNKGSSSKFMVFWDWGSSLLCIIESDPGQFSIEWRLSSFILKKNHLISAVGKNKTVTTCSKLEFIIIFMCYGFKLPWKWYLSIIWTKRARHNKWDRVKDLFSNYLYDLRMTLKLEEKKDTWIKNDVLHTGCSHPVWCCDRQQNASVGVVTALCWSSCTLNKSCAWPTEGWNKMAVGRQAWYCMEHRKGQRLPFWPIYLLPKIL